MLYYKYANRLSIYLTAGGTFNTEWLELNLGQRDWSSLTELSLPHCGLSRVNLPSSAVPKLMSLDLTGNHLSTFSGITSLPKYVK